VNSQIPNWNLRFGIAVVVALAIGAAFAVPSAVAIFRSAHSVAGNAFASALVGMPSALSGMRQGQNIYLSWHAGTNGDGYQILRATNTAPTCVSVLWQPLAHVAGIGTTHYTDTANKRPGNWYCYQVRTTLSTWTSQSNNPTAAVQ
jgi:hypothetical protein